MNLLVLGHMGMALEGEQARLVNGEIVRDEIASQFFYVSWFYNCWVGFLNLTFQIVGQLYSKDDPRRDPDLPFFTWE